MRQSVQEPTDIEIDTRSGADLKPVTRLLGWYTVCYVLSFIGYWGTAQGLWFWYVSLLRPALSPPNWAITPTWTVLYALIAWASWQVWTSPPSRDRTLGLRLFFGQLALNAFWPWLFFAWRLAVPSVIALLILSATVLANTTVFWKVQPRAGRLMIPYLVWVVFVTILYTVVWRLNR